MHMCTKLASMALAFIGLAIVPVQAAPDWLQNVAKQEAAALPLHQPVVVFFIQNGRFDTKIFDAEPLDAIAAKAKFAWVGPNIASLVDAGQFAMERALGVGDKATLLILRPVQTGNSVTWHETTRCVVNKPGVCAAVIVSAVQSGK
jgi:hypothetical protein